MRCNNCGWDNPDGALKCTKCNAPLDGSMANNYQSMNQEPVSSANMLKKTVREVGGNVSSPSDEMNCPRCGYPIAEGMRICPQCGSSINAQVAPRNEIPAFHGQQKVSPMMGTVNSWVQPENGSFCSLKMVAWANEANQYAPVTYSGNPIVLNRQNTDPNNQTITSKEQAVLTFKDGDWYIEDHSSQHTTFVQVRGSVKLQPGDIIALGNRLFEFQS